MPIPLMELGMYYRQFTGDWLNAAVRYILPIAPNSSIIGTLSQYNLDT
ncbi:MAG: hypothetical protein ACXWFB_12835 [Nitrososphaeraceae archaeon]